MNDREGKRRVRGGENLLAKLSKPAECEEDKRLLCAKEWCGVKEVLGRGWWMH